MSAAADGSDEKLVTQASLSSNAFDTSWSPDGKTIAVTLQESGSTVDALGHRVVELQRIRFGPLQLGEIAIGSVRRLTPNAASRRRPPGRSRRRWWAA